jgi:hypothetical protein
MYNFTPFLGNLIWAERYVPTYYHFIYKNVIHKIFFWFLIRKTIRPVYGTTQMRTNGFDYNTRLATTGGAHTPGSASSIDHVSLETVFDAGVNIANLRMSGIFDKTGRLPLNGEENCLKIVPQNDSGYKFNDDE